MSRIFLNAVTRTERHAAIGLVRTALSDAGAWVLDFLEYSNVSATIAFAVAADRVGRLSKALATLPFAWKEGDLAELAGPRRGEEIQGSLQIIFVHSEPDVKQIIPSVPG